MTNMKEITYRSIAAAIIFLFAANGYAQCGIPEIKKRMHQFNDRLKTLRATVRIVKTEAATGLIQQTNGTAIYSKGKGKSSFFRIDIIRPEEESMSVRNGQYVQFRPRLRLAYSGAVPSSGPAHPFEFLWMPTNQLAAEYDAALLDTGAPVDRGVGAFHFELTPRSHVLFKSVELWVDPKVGMIHQLKFVQANNDSTTISLLDPELNVDIRDSEFDIKFPHGTQVRKAGSEGTRRW